MASQIITTVGREIALGRVAGQTTVGAVSTIAQPQFMGWGTAVGTSANADTTLFTEDSAGSPAYARATGVTAFTTTTLTDDTLRIIATLTANASKTITNMGIFDAVSAGNLFLKADFAGVPLNLNDSIQGTWTWQLL